MNKNCNNCGTEKQQMTMVSMSSADWQKNEQRHERREKRHIWIHVLLILLLVGSNIAWLAYESQFETIETIEEYEADADDGGNAIINDDGSVNING